MVLAVPTRSLRQPVRRQLPLPRLGDGCCGRPVRPLQRLPLRICKLGHGSAKCYFGAAGLCLLRQATCGAVHHFVEANPLCADGFHDNEVIQTFRKRVDSASWSKTLPKVESHEHYPNQCN